MMPQEEGKWQALLRTLSMRSPKEQTKLLAELTRDAPQFRPDMLPARFRIVRRIGQGGFGAVYEAYDEQADRPVAIKILRNLYADSLYRFKQEFRVLADLRHPNLVELYELFDFDDVWLFSMELVRGESFVRHVRPSNCDLTRLRRAVSDLVRVLAWLHASGIVHRDIKPDNVMVNDAGRLVLLDFGLARHLSLGTDSATISAGTPAYMAPEQMSDVPATAAADLYAVGALIYTALTGRPPFEGPVLRVLTAKASQDATPPSAIAEGVPPDWDQMCCRLLHRRPEARPQASELLAWLAGGASEAPVTSVVTSRVCVGREAALTRMLATCNAPPAVLELSGLSGFGKSALLQTFVEEVAERHPGALVLRGRCYEHESVPFKAIDALVDDLSRHLHRMGSAAADVLPRDVATLARVFPVLGRVDAVGAILRSSEMAGLNPLELRRRAFVAFASMLERLARRGLLVICLDDIHWGDADSAALFQHLYATQPVPPFILAVSHRSDATEGEFTMRLRRHIDMAASQVGVISEFVGPLPPAAATELASILLKRRGVLADAQALAADCGGNPLMIEQVVASLVGAEVAGAPSRQGTLAEIVLERVKRLSAPAREFVQMLACLGEPLPEKITLRLPHSDSGAIASLISQRLVRVRDSGGHRELDIYHEQIRAAVVQAVPDEERHALHIRIAEALISAGYDDGAVAVQLARGGDEARAAVYAERAAEAAEALLAFDRAAQFYGMAVALARLDRAKAAALHRRLADACASAGRGPDAARAYEKAAELSTDQETRIELRRYAAEACIRGGNVREGVSVLMSLGSEFHIRRTDSTVAAATSIAVSRAALWLRGLKYTERAESELPRRNVARLDVYWALTAGLSLWNPIIGAAYQLKHLRLALREGEPRRIGLALATEAGYRCLSGERAYAEARSLLNDSLAIADRLGDPAIAGTAQALGGMCGWLTGRWDVARDAGLEGERTLRERCSGVSWQLSVARNAALGGLLWSGDWIDYSARLSEWTRDAEDRGDLASLSVYRMNHSPLSLAADDPAQATADLEQAERILQQAWSERGFHVPHFFGVFGRAGVALYRGSAAAEFEALEQQFRRVRGSMLLRIETIAVLAAMLEAALAIAAAPGNPALLRKARTCAVLLRRRRAVWSLGMAMLIEAGIEAASGRMNLAVARWADAERELSRSGMRMYAAAAQLCRGRAAGDKELVQAAAAVFRSQGVRSPERMAMSLAPGIPA